MVHANVQMLALFIMEKILKKKKTKENLANKWW